MAASTQSAIASCASLGRCASRSDGQRRGPRDRLAAHPFGPLLQAKRPRDSNRYGFRHPLLDRKLGYPEDRPVMSDDEIRRLVDDFVTAAKLARECGADFVDIKHCHGYLAHEFLSAHTRPGLYGGSFENRTRILREIVAGIRAEVPGIGIGVRLSAFDNVPFRPDPAQSQPGELGPGIPEEFGRSCPMLWLRRRPGRSDTDRSYGAFAFVELCVSSMFASSISRSRSPPTSLMSRAPPFPASEAISRRKTRSSVSGGNSKAVRRMKARLPRSLRHRLGLHLFAGVPAECRTGRSALRWADVIGLGRMLLAYPELPRDILEGKAVQRKRLCRHFQRLHHGAEERPRLGLLPARCALQKIRRIQALGRAQEACAHSVRQRARA